MKRRPTDRGKRWAVIDPFAAYLRQREAAYPDLTCCHLFCELKELGYKRGYTAVTDLLRDVRRRREPTSRFASRRPRGEQAQVDVARFQVSTWPTPEPETE